MKVIANRAELLALCKRAAKLANDSSPIEEFRGILLDADGDAGQIRVSATNMEVSLRGRMKAEVRESSSLILNGKMAVGMLSLLQGDLVALHGQSNNTLLLAGGRAKYIVSVLPGRRYPPIELPFPVDTVQVSGIPTMARRTVFAASEDNDRATMKCINMIFTEDGLKAVSSDGSRIMSVKGESKGGGAVSLLIPARSLSLLAGMSTDEDIYSVGATGKSIVFMREGLLLSARTIEGKYINADSIIETCQPQFTVLTDGEALYKALDSVTTLGDSGGTVSLGFESNAIELSFSGEMGTARGRLDIIPLTGTPNGTYHYPAQKLRECLKAMGGTMQLKIGQNGVMLMCTEQATCLSVAMRAPSVKKSDTPKAKAA